jgi:D-alanyl-D-alanine carboxypeptidase (penicillin-binding protein 5/6)
MDAATGTIVYSKNPDEEIPPASLTKLMTMHLTFNEIEAGRASLDEVFTPPREGWAVSQPPLSSLMGIAAGHSLSLRDLLLGMVIFSGNDAATATALRFAPSLSAFAEVMTREAAALGLGKTRFVDASGYSEDNMTTAREYAEFCRIYIEAHPYSIADYHSVTEFAYPRPENLPEQYRANPGTRLQRNRITLLGRVEGVDGLKTGFIFESGYNIALTAERGGTRFIVIILGGPSDRIRDDDGEKLINWAFANYKTIRPNVGVIMPFRIWKGKADYVGVFASEPLDFTALAERGEYLDVVIEQEDTLIAPLSANSPVGNIVLYDTFGELRRIPLLTAGEVERGNFFKRLIDSIRLFFRRRFS